MSCTRQRQMAGVPRGSQQAFASSPRELPGERVEPRGERLRGAVQDRSPVWVLKRQDPVWCREAQEDR